jgi:hypothetical protein
MVGRGGKEGFQSTFEGKGESLAWEGFEKDAPNSLGEGFQNLLLKVYTKY